MTRMTVFNSPFLLGFDQIERTLDRLTKAADAYPPYNVEQTGPDTYAIVLAVAGFQVADLTVTLDDNQLVIRGKQSEEPEKTYIHRGIAARQFQRAFLIAEGMEVTGADLSNGLLTIMLKRPRADAVVRAIPITTGAEPSPRPRAPARPGEMKLAGAERLTVAGIEE